MRIAPRHANGPMFAIGLATILSAIMPLTLLGQGDLRLQSASTVELVADGSESAVALIVDEGKNRNQVMEHLTYLTQEIGPRLTGSSRARRANEWTRDQFRSWGLRRARIEKWGEIPIGFDRGVSYAKMVEPVERDLEFSWRAWSPGTDGPVRGIVIKEPTTDEEFEAVADQLEGAWILRKASLGRRGRGRRRPANAGGDAQSDMLDRLREAGIAGLVTTSGRGGELVHTGGARGWRDLDYDDLPTDVSVTLRRSDYDAMNSRLADGEKVVLEFDLNCQFVEGPVPCYNTIAEIPGTVWPDEVVIISGHLDSWDGPGSQGTIDNGTGSSVTLEAARILMATGAQPKRTIRFILWTGEEQGLLGSRGYVESLSAEELSKISAVFVDDGGTNYEGGLVCIESMAPMLRAAVAPLNEAFPDMPVVIDITERMPRGGGSDHASFNRVGVPGFFWKETGRSNYRYGWHTQNDRLDLAIPEYLVQSSTCAAITALYLANADTLLPRQVEEEEEEKADVGGGGVPATTTGSSGGSR